MRRHALLAFFAPCLFSQTLNVYSEFARIDASGMVTSPANPREILSPMLVRNGFTSFQIVLEADKGAEYRLYIGLNPPDAVKVTVYRELENRLDPVDLPFHGEGPAAFWMDVWCDPSAPVRRIKIEPELFTAGDWVRYPMEARVMDATVPDKIRPFVAGLREFLCGRDSAIEATSTLRDRNARQDAALAQGIAKQILLRQMGKCPALLENPEAYLRLRDYLFRVR